MPQYYIVANYGDAPSAALQDMFGRIEYFDSRADAEENVELLDRFGRHYPKPKYVIVEVPEKPQDGQSASEAAAYRDQLGIVPVGSPGPVGVSAVVARQMLEALRAATKDADWHLEEGDAYPPWLEAAHAAIAAAEKAGL
jgi:hypothetical protein